MSIKRGNTDISDVLFRGESISDIKIKDVGQLISEVEEYTNRVISDGGEIIDEEALQSFVELLKQEGIWDNVQGLFSPSFGIKLNAGQVDKLYNVKKASDFVPESAVTGTFNASGQNGEPIITDGDPYIIDQDKNWLRNVPAGWGIFVGSLDLGSGSNQSALYIGTGNNGAARFYLYRDGTVDDRFDIAFNPEDDFTNFAVSNDEDDLGGFASYSGWVNLAGQEVESSINNVVQRYVQSGAIPNVNFPDTESFSIHTRMDDFALLLFADMKPTTTQKTAVFNWLNNFYTIT